MSAFPWRGSQHVVRAAQWAEREKRAQAIRRLVDAAGAAGITPPEIRQALDLGKTAFDKAIALLRRRGQVVGLGHATLRRYWRPGLEPAAPPQPRRRRQSAPGVSHARPRAAGTHPRPCLACGKSFPSEGPHNRLCNRCRRDEDAVLGQPW